MLPTSYEFDRPGLHSAEISETLFLLSLLKSGSKWKMFQLIWILEDMGNISIKYFSFSCTCVSPPYDTLLPSSLLSLSVIFYFYFIFYISSYVYYVYLRLSSSFLISSLLWLLLALLSLSDLPCSTHLIFFLFASVSCLLLLQIRAYWVAYDKTVSFKTKKC